MAPVLVVGCFGQDGNLLCESLRRQDIPFIGLGKDSFIQSQVCWEKSINIKSANEVAELVSKVRPKQIYYLASYHHSSEDSHNSPLDELHKSYEINLFGLSNFLEAIRVYSPLTKLFYAGSSHIFGNVNSKVQDENHSMQPETIYGHSKLAGLNLCKWYRKNFNLFAAVGILYNHESHLRRDSFLSKKIVKTAFKISKKKADRLTIGNLQAEVDWGYAPDFVDAFQKIMALNQADDFIVATGQTHTAQEFIDIAFKEFNLEPKDYIVENKSELTRTIGTLCGSYRKLNQMTGWTPRTSFEEMIVLLAEHERNLV